MASPDLMPPRGGAELRFLRYIQGLKKRMIATSVITGTPTAHKIIESDKTKNWYTYPVGKLFQPEVVEGTRVHRVRLPDNNGSERSLILTKMVIQLFQENFYRPDVFQLLSFVSPSSIPYLKKLRATGAATVYAYTLPKEIPRNPIKRFFRLQSLRSVYNQFDCIVTNSLFSRKTLTDLGVKTQIELIPNGVDINRFRPAFNKDERNAIKMSLNINPETEVILTVGAVHPRKGIDLLLESFINLSNHFPETQLFIIGMRHDLHKEELTWFGNKLKDMLFKSGISNRVHFLGQIDNVEEYYKIADVFVLSSKREGMPNSVLEAMASSVPVVMTSYAGLSADFGESGKNYLLTNYDTQLLSEALACLLKNPDLRKEIGFFGRKWVNETMNFDKVLDRYAELYNNLFHQSIDTPRIA